MSVELLLEGLLVLLAARPMTYTLRFELNVRTRAATSLYGNVPEPFRHAYHRLFHPLPSAKQRSLEMLGDAWRCAITDIGRTLGYYGRSRWWTQVNGANCCFQRSGCLSSLDVAFLRFDLPAVDAHVLMHVNQIEELSARCAASHACLSLAILAGFTENLFVRDRP